MEEGELIHEDRGWRIEGIGYMAEESVLWMKSAGLWIEDRKFRMED